MPRTKSNNRITMEMSPPTLIAPSPPSNYGRESDHHHKLQERNESVVEALLLLQSFQNNSTTTGTPGGQSTNNMMGSNMGSAFGEGDGIVNKKQILKTPIGKSGFCFSVVGLISCVYVWNRCFLRLNSFIIRARYHEKLSKASATARL